MIAPRKASQQQAPARKAVRCAIYTRKSTEEGLDQDFNSLDAQRESAEAYIRSQAHEGWRLVPTRYDDGGFSGGNLDRPALAALLEDIKAGKVDCVVVYKVDRLSRSLMDFSRLVEVFEAHRVSFVSVTQQFNTTHSMGRLTLNILLSFAQFEREIIGERIRDKLAAHKRKGKWTGGRPVLGYDVDRSARSPRLRVNEADAIIDRETFDAAQRRMQATGALAGSRRPVGPDLRDGLGALRIPGHLKVVAGLKIHPELRGRLEVGRETQGSVRAERTGALHEASDPVCGHARVLGKAVHRDPEWHQELLVEDLTGVDRAMAVGADARHGDLVQW